MRNREKYHNCWMYLSRPAKAFNYIMEIVGNELPTMTRRRWVCAATRAGFGLFAAADMWAASEFWNKKDPSAWTSDEVLQLATRSPWAKTGRVLPKPGRDRGSFQRTDPALAGGGGGRSENPRVGEVAIDV